MGLKPSGNASAAIPLGAGAADQTCQYQKPPPASANTTTTARGSSIRLARGIAIAVTTCASSRGMVLEIMRDQRLAFGGIPLRGALDAPDQPALAVEHYGDRQALALESIEEVAAGVIV